MVGVQIEREEPVANDIFLAVPSIEVGLGQFHCISLWSGANHRNEFRFEGYRRSRHCLPSLLPELCLMRGEVSLPAARSRFRNGFCRKQLAPIADQGHCHLYRWASGIWSW